MCWYWGATLTIVTGLIFAGIHLYSGVPEHLIATLSRRAPLRLPWLLGESLTTIIYFAPPIIFSVLLYCWFTRFDGGRSDETETRCRKCRYILRGIPEPRCPECGERI